MDGPTSRSHRGRALPPRAPADADPPAEVVPCHRAGPPPQLRRLPLRPCASAAAYASQPAAIAAIGRWNAGWWYPEEPPLRRSRSSDAPSVGLPSPPTDRFSRRVKGGREPPPPPPEESDGGVTRFTTSRVALRAFGGERRLSAARSERRRWAGLVTSGAPGGVDAVLGVAPWRSRLHHDAGIAHLTTRATATARHLPRRAGRRIRRRSCTAISGGRSSVLVASLTRW
ncbi:hypothetical protein PVAP13_4NG225100 [Panicum virgatum]|uniref:Uncharacterized protein n=1 Tax=Panicum virgatum TaxID=38727 RepID=A0A8T0T510_PANVG|nr:hypothetical protein PVAP13_4NG225100 [Panicum virgatum]